MAQSFADILTFRAKEMPNKVAFTFLTDAGNEETLTFHTLHQKAKLIAQTLLELNIKQNERALLLYQPGLDYILALYGCLYASVIAIPVYLPYNTETTLKIKHIIANATPTICLTTSQLKHKFKMLSVAQKLVPSSLKELLPLQLKNKLNLNPDGLKKLLWLATDTLSERNINTKQLDNIPVTQIAYLQYTSGSTGQPKGVIITHENLLHNIAGIQNLWHFSSNEKIVGWLPPYHDFGLIGGILQPVYHGWTSHLMSPLTFLQNPIVWLKAISQHKGSVSGGPNFAYQYCINKITEEEKEELDLSSWYYAVNGAEPIRTNTLRDFIKAFAPCGFPHNAFTPTYGLAENTLMVTGKRRRRSIIGQIFSPEIENNIVGCGISFADQELCIVNPTTLELLPEYETGEIWVKSKSVAQGYFGNEDLTQRIFKAYTKTGKGPFLRTGDLGFLKNNELFINGRLKDLIILQGQNFYPQDLELTTEEAHAILRPGCTAVFSITHADQEEVVIVQEAKSSTEEIYHQAAENIKRNILKQHGIMVYAVLLIKAKTIPKTTSGKIRRQTTRSYYELNQLEVLYHLAKQNVESTPRLNRNILSEISHILNIDVSQYSMETTLQNLGINSLQAVEIQNLLSTYYEKMCTISELTNMTLSQLKTGNFPERLIEMADSKAVSTFSFSAINKTQELCLKAKKPNIISLGCLIKGKLNLKVLEEAILSLTDRHDVLRSTFTMASNEIKRKIHPTINYPFITISMPDLKESEYEKRSKSICLSLIKEINRNKNQALFVICVIQIEGDKNIFILCIDHLIIDGYSLRIFLEEMVTLYHAKIQKKHFNLKPLKSSYRDFILWQNAEINKINVNHFNDFRKSIINLPKSNLIADNQLDFKTHGKLYKKHLTLSKASFIKLKKFSQSQHVDIFSILLTAYKIYILTLSNRPLPIRTNYACRDNKDWQQLMGFFATSLIVGGEFTPSYSFKMTLQSTSDAVQSSQQFKSLPFGFIQEAFEKDGIATHHNWIPAEFNFLPFALAPIKMGDHRYEILNCFNIHHLGFSLQLLGYFFKDSIRLTLLFRDNLKKDILDSLSLKKYTALLYKLLDAPDEPIKNLN